MQANIEHIAKITLHCTREEYEEEQYAEVLKSLGFKFDNSWMDSTGTRFTVVGIKHLAPSKWFNPAFADPVLVVREGLNKMMDEYTVTNEQPTEKEPESNGERVTIGDAARELGLSTSSVRMYFGMGRLERIRENGYTFVSRKSVEEYKQHQADRFVALKNQFK